MSRISFEELKSYLWGSAVLLRNNIDAGSYKQYIFPLLFFKRMSDVYDEECENFIEENGSDEGVEFPENHTFCIPEKCHWNDLREATENIGKTIVEIFRKIEKANPDQLNGIFGDGAWTNKNRLPDRLLKDLVEHFSSKVLSIKNCPEDELGTGYEYLIKKFADDSGHTAQEFYTNRTLVDLMSRILKPKPSESIYDPTCGSAGMLISCVNYLKKHNDEWRNVKVYGQELNQLTSSIGRMNLFLHGIKDFKVVNDDTLINPYFLDNGELKTFNVVLANPPYSIKQWDRESFAKDKYGRNFLGTPPQGRADYAFFQHILKSLDKENGRCAILFPHGVLGRNDEDEMRSKLIDLDLIDVVIGVGKNLFYNSPMEACVVICKTNKESSHKNKIMFIDAKDEITRKNAESYLEEKHISKIIDAYESYKNIPGFCSVISTETIKNNENLLTISSYVYKEKRVEVVSIFKAYDDYKNNHETSKLISILEDIK